MADNLLFVYGILRPGYGRLAQGTTHIGPATLQGRLYEIGGGIAGLKLEGEPLTIHGDLLEVDKAHLSYFDRIEGYDEDYPEGSFYIRTETPVLLDSGESFMAWVYVYNGQVSEQRLIASGDWLAEKQHV